MNYYLILDVVELMPGKRENIGKTVLSGIGKEIWYVPSVVTLFSIGNTLLKN